MPAFDQKKNLIVIRKVIVLMRDTESRSGALSAMMATGITANPKSWPKTAYNRSVFTPKLPKSTMSFGHGDSLEYEQTVDRAQQFCDSAVSIVDAFTKYMCRVNCYHSEGNPRAVWNRFGDSLRSCPAHVLMPEGMSPIEGSDKRGIVDFARRINPEEICGHGPPNKKKVQIIKWAEDMIQKNMFILAGIAAFQETKNAPYEFLAHPDGLQDDIRVLASSTKGQLSGLYNHSVKQAFIDAVEVGTQGSSEGFGSETQDSLLPITDFAGHAIHAKLSDVYHALIEDTNSYRVAKNTANTDLHKRQRKVAQEDGGLVVPCLFTYTWLKFFNPDNFGKSKGDLNANLAYAFFAAAIDALKESEVVDALLKWDGEKDNDYVYQLFTPIHLHGITTMDADKTRQPCTENSPFGRYTNHDFDKQAMYTSGSSMREQTYRSHFNDLWGKAYDMRKEVQPKFDLLWTKMFRHSGENAVSLEEADKQAESMNTFVGVYQQTDWQLFICDLFVFMAHSSYNRNSNPTLSSSTKMDSILTQASVVSTIAEQLHEFIYDSSIGRAFNHTISLLMKPSMALMNEEGYQKIIENQNDQVGKSSAQSEVAELKRRVHAVALRKMAGIPSGPPSADNATPSQVYGAGAWTHDISTIKLNQSVQAFMAVIQDLVASTACQIQDVRLTPDALGSINNPHLRMRPTIDKDMHYTQMIRYLEQDGSNKENVMALDAAMNAFMTYFQTVQDQNLHSEGDKDVFPSQDPVAFTFKLNLLTRRTLIPLFSKYVLLKLFKKGHGHTPEVVDDDGDMLERADILGAVWEVFDAEYWVKVMVFVRYVYEKYADQLPDPVHRVMEAEKDVFKLNDVSTAALQDLSDDTDLKQRAKVFGKVDKAFKDNAKKERIEIAVTKWKYTVMSSPEMRNLLEALNALREEHFKPRLEMSVHPKQNKNDPNDHAAWMPPMAVAARFCYRLFTTLHAMIPTEPSEDDGFPGMRVYLNGKATTTVGRKFGEMVRRGEEFGVEGIDTFKKRFSDILQEVQQSTLKPKFEQQICKLWVNVWRTLVFLEALAAPGTATSHEGTSFMTPTTLRDELQRSIQSTIRACDQFAAKVEAEAPPANIMHVNPGYSSTIPNLEILGLGQRRPCKLRDAVLEKIFDVDTKTVGDRKVPQDFSVHYRAKQMSDHSKRRYQRATHQSPELFRAAFGDELTTYPDPGNQFGSIKGYGKGSRSAKGLAQSRNSDPLNAMKRSLGFGHPDEYGQQQGSKKQAHDTMMKDPLMLVYALARLVDPIGTSVKYHKGQDSASQKNEQAEFQKRTQKNYLQALAGVKKDKFNALSKAAEKLIVMMKGYANHHLRYSTSKSTWEQKHTLFCLNDSKEVGARVAAAMFSQDEDSHDALAEILTTLTAYKMQILTRHHSKLCSVDKATKQIIDLRGVPKRNDVDKWEMFVKKAGKVWFAVAIARLSCILTQCENNPGLHNLKHIVEYIDWIDSVENAATYRQAIEGLREMEYGWQSEKHIHPAVSGVIATDAQEIVRRLLRARYSIRKDQGCETDLVFTAVKNHVQEYKTDYAAKTGGFAKELLNVKGELKKWCSHGVETMGKGFLSNYGKQQHQVVYAIRSVPALCNLVRYYRFAANTQDAQNTYPNKVLKHMLQSHMYHCYKQALEEAKNNFKAYNVHQGGANKYKYDVGDSDLSFGWADAASAKFKAPNYQTARGVIGKEKGAKARVVRKAHAGPGPRDSVGAKFHKQCMKKAHNMVKLLIDDIGFVVEYAKKMHPDLCGNELKLADGSDIKEEHIDSMYNALKTAFASCPSDQSFGEYKQPSKLVLFKEHAKWKHIIDTKIANLQAEAGTDVYVDLDFLTSDGKGGNKDAADPGKDALDISGYNFQGLPAYGNPFEVQSSTGTNDDDVANKYLAYLFSDNYADVYQKFNDLKVAGAAAKFFDSVPKVYTSHLSEPLEDIRNDGNGLFEQWRSYYGIYMANGYDKDDEVDIDDKLVSSKCEDKYSTDPNDEWGVQDMGYLPKTYQFPSGDNIDLDVADTSKRTQFNRYKINMYNDGATSDFAEVTHGTAGGASAYTMPSAPGPSVTVKTTTDHILDIKSHSDIADKVAELETLDQATIGHVLETLVGNSEQKLAGDLLENMDPDNAADVLFTKFLHTSNAASALAEVDPARAMLILVLGLQVVTRKDFIMMMMNAMDTDKASAIVNLIIEDQQVPFLQEMDPSNAATIASKLGLSLS